MPIFVFCLRTSVLWPVRPTSDVFIALQSCVPAIAPQGVSKVCRGSVDGVPKEARVEGVPKTPVCVEGVSKRRRQIDRR